MALWFDHNIVNIMFLKNKLSKDLSQKIFYIIYVYKQIINITLNINVKLNVGE